MAFVVAALFALVMGVLIWLDASRAEETKLPLGSIAMLYTGVLAILVGSSASANERQFWNAGVADPSATTGMAAVGGQNRCGLGTCSSSGNGLPALMGAFEASPEILQWRTAVRSQPSMMLLLTSVSVYLSTLSTSGVEALVLSFPTIVATSFLTMTIGNIVGPVVMHEPTGASIVTVVPGARLGDS